MNLTIYLKMIMAIVTFLICASSFAIGLYGFYDSSLTLGLSGLLLGAGLTYFVYSDYQELLGPKNDSKS